MNELLPYVNLLLVPAVGLLYRIDRRQGQLDIIVPANTARIDRLELRQDEINNRVTTLEAKV